MAKKALNMGVVKGDQSDIFRGIETQLYNYFHGYSSDFEKIIMYTAITTHNPPASIRPSSQGRVFRRRIGREARHSLQ